MFRADATPVTVATAVTERRRQPLPSGGAGARRVEPRDPYLDNAKYLAILLVATGHAWEPLREGSRAVTTLYTLVYAFHMPLFITLSGYFSRGYDGRPERVRRLVTGLVVPYVVFEVAYTCFTRWTSQDPDRPISLLEPLYLTWYLAALFVWRLTSPVWKLLRWPMPVALGLAILATVSPSIGDDLDLQRVLQFLPYFVLGLCLKPEHLELVRRREVRLLAVPVLGCALAVAYWAVPRMNYAWFFHSDSARELGAPAWCGPVMTLATFGCSIVLVACFLAWVPGRRTWFTVLGAGTLGGYLLHGFVAQVAEFRGWYDGGWVRQPVGEVTVTLVAAAVMTALCAPAVQRVFRRVTAPRSAYAFLGRRPIRRTACRSLDG
ncbi:acyltransferase family protein [Streptomyces bicolor]|uniref:acyltransferase family protein n=1 Tax=Streptomyces bicolor TaxID=66874 RepID=UPI0009960B4F|nr:acyltransferase family protein [Streptomyces bicolor]